MTIADFCFPLKSAIVCFMDSFFIFEKKEFSDENYHLVYGFIELIYKDLQRFVELKQKIKRGYNRRNIQNRYYVAVADLENI